LWSSAGGKPDAKQNHYGVSKEYFHVSLVLFDLFAASQAELKTQAGD
jgi:hypothetical protein